MKKDISNFDKNGNLDGKQISYYDNGNILAITNYNHGKLNGYRAGFNLDKSIRYKLYFNTGKWIYEENHYNNQIEINI